MAPIEPLNSNVKPFAYFGTYLTVTISLIYLIAHRVFYRAHRELPPSQATRTRQHNRRNHIQIYSALSLLSLGISAYYTYDLLSLSYNAWLYERGQYAPGTLWAPSGFFGGKGSAPRLELGRWLRDIDLAVEHWGIPLAKSGGRWWAQQYFIGLSIFSVFVSLEGGHISIKRGRIMLTATRSSSQYPASMGICGPGFSCFAKFCAQSLLPSCSLDSSTIPRS